MRAMARSVFLRTKSLLSSLDRTFLGGRIKKIYFRNIKDRHWAANKYRHEISRLKFQEACLALRSTSLAIDCGANIGTYTELMARSGARVLAIDPEPLVHETLDRLVDKYTNITVLKAAASTADSNQLLYRRSDLMSDPLTYSQSSSIMNDKINIDTESYINVETISLSRLVMEFGYVDLVKMDIEGAEIDVIEDLIETGAMDHIGLMFVETHEDRVPSIKRRTAALRSKLHDLYPGRVNLDWE